MRHGTDGCVGTFGRARGAACEARAPAAMCGVSRKHRGAEARGALGRGCAGGARPGPGAEGPMWGLSGTSGGAGGLHRACRSGPSSRGSRRRAVLWGPGGGRAHPVWPAPGRAGREAPARRCPADPRPGPGPARPCSGHRARLCPRVRPGPCGQGGLLLPIAPRPVSQADGGWEGDVAGAAVARAARLSWPCTGLDPGPSEKPKAVGLHACPFPTALATHSH